MKQKNRFKNKYVFICKSNYLAHHGEVAELESVDEFADDYPVHCSGIDVSEFVAGHTDSQAVLRLSRSQHRRPELRNNSLNDIRAGPRRGEGCPLSPFFES